jgi:hypothetical protein
LSTAARTFPEHEFFKNDIGQAPLFNILKGYSNLDADVGYCQGMSFLAGLLLLHVKPILDLS